MPDRNRDSEERSAPASPRATDLDQGPGTAGVPGGGPDAFTTSGGSQIVYLGNTPAHRPRDEEARNG